MLGFCFRMLEGPGTGSRKEIPTIRMDQFLCKFS